MGGRRPSTNQRAPLAARRISSLWLLRYKASNPGETSNKRWHDSQSENSWPAQESYPWCIWSHPECSVGWLRWRLESRSQEQTPAALPLCILAQSEGSIAVAPPCGGFVPCCTHTMPSGSALKKNKDHKSIYIKKSPSGTLRKKYTLHKYEQGSYGRINVSLDIRTIQHSNAILTIFFFFLWQWELS